MDRLLQFEDFLKLQCLSNGMEVPNMFAAGQLMQTYTFLSHPSGNTRTRKSSEFAERTEAPSV